MRRLYVELAVPDDLNDGDPVDVANLVLISGTADVVKARWSEEAAEVSMQNDT